MERGVLSMPNMTGRPEYRTMEMNGGSSAPYLACTPCVPLFCTSLNGGRNRRAFRPPGAGGGSFPLYGGTFARSYSVSILTIVRREDGEQSCQVTHTRGKRFTSVNQDPDNPYP